MLCRVPLCGEQGWWVWGTSVRALPQVGKSVVNLWAQVDAGCDVTPKDFVKHVGRKGLHVSGTCPNTERGLFNFGWFQCPKTGI